jgi:hypothetical protein
MIRRFVDGLKRHIEDQRAPLVRKLSRASGIPPLERELLVGRVQVYDEIEEAMNRLYTADEDEIDELEEQKPAPQPLTKEQLAASRRRRNRGRPRRWE